MNHMTNNNALILVIIDIECTCDSPVQLPTEQIEIIEIGAIAGRLDRASFPVVDDFQVYVKPEIHTQLTPFCRELTGIRQNQVDEADSLPQALANLGGWLGSVSPAAWGSWGKFDQRHIQMEAERKSLPNPLDHLLHLNIKQLFARKRGHRVGLGRALDLSGMEFKGRQHSGIDDARNIGRLLAWDAVLREAVLQRIGA